jgi:hypothetical protein
MANSLAQSDLIEPTPAEIDSFLRKQIELWNALDRPGMEALYRRYAPNGLIIEYVGQPIGDGWAAFNHLWDNYGDGQIRTDIKEILVNGSEGACYFHNVRKATGGANPSIEIYSFGGGKLHIRYFHRSLTVS